MSELTDRSLMHLSPAAARLGHVFARPRTVAVGCVVALSALGWTYLGLVAADLPDAFAVLCRPVGGARNELLVLGMWCAMSLAMMLPSAGPMIFTYAEIADTAARKGEVIISPFILAAGYTIMWLGFSLVATAVHLSLSSATWPKADSPAAVLASGAVFIVAGLYQFSPLKQACLHQCQRPFPFFFTHWATTPAGVFRLGLMQGGYCLGCCWALMLVMLATGTMNVVWMAILGAVMTIEKMTATPRFAKAVGATLIAFGAVFMVSTLSGVWLD